jgi:glycosyltransferase involved in cell wall biosynthesis
MISIIIPTLNEEKIIEKTLQNLKGLTDIPCEIIVSDGRSTDRTIEIAKKYATKVIVYEGTARQTIGMGRNLGVSVATGEYLLFLDADMYVPDINNFFKKALDIFEKKKLVGLSAYLKVFPEMANFGDKVVFWTSNHMFYVMNDILNMGASYGEFQMVRTDIFKKLHGYDEMIAVAEDNEFFKRLAGAGDTWIEPSLVVFHTSRRAHKIGWPKLLFQWWINQASVLVRKKSYHDEWKVIR